MTAIIDDFVRALKTGESLAAAVDERARPESLPTGIYAPDAWTWSGYSVSRNLENRRLVDHFEITHFQFDQKGGSLELQALNDESLDALTDLHAVMDGRHGMTASRKRRHDNLLAVDLVWDDATFDPTAGRAAKPAYIEVFSGLKRVASAYLKEILTSYNVSFLCIGAPRAGTTWLYQLLRRHPGVFLPPVKELRHFVEPRTLQGRTTKFAKFRDGQLSPLDQRFLDQWLVYDSNDDRAYQDLFDQPEITERGLVCGDITPAYCAALRKDVHRIREAVGPDCKVLFLIRNPVDRDISHLGLMRSNGRRIVDQATAMRALQSPDQRRRSNYPRTIKLWRQQFGPDRVRVIVYDRIVDQPRGVLAEICEFLGVAYSDELFPDDVIEQRVNSRVGQVREMQFIDALRCDLAKLHLQEIRELRQLFPGDPYIEEWWRTTRALVKATPPGRNAKGKLPDEPAHEHPHEAET